MKPTVEGINALENLGLELEKAGWQASGKIAEAFEVGGSDERKTRVLSAVTYLNSYSPSRVN